MKYRHKDLLASWVTCDSASCCNHWRKLGFLPFGTNNLVSDFMFSEIWRIGCWTNYLPWWWLSSLVHFSTVYSLLRFLLWLRPFQKSQHLSKISTVQDNKAIGSHHHLSFLLQSVFSIFSFNLITPSLIIKYIWNSLCWLIKKKFPLWKTSEIFC